jgi:hypothetical protein
MFRAHIEPWPLIDGWRAKGRCVRAAFLNPAFKICVDGGQLCGADSVVDNQAAIAPKTVNLMLA